MKSNVQFEFDFSLSLSLSLSRVYSSVLFYPIRFSYSGHLQLIVVAIQTLSFKWKICENYMFQQIGTYTQIG